MANHQPVNPQQHGKLRVNRTRSAEFGDAQMAALVIPEEFRKLQAHYPIVFQKSAERDAIRCIALLGFEKDENLFLTDDGWDAPYVPLTMDIPPFLVGLSRDKDKPAHVHLDMDHPRLGEKEGEPLFDEHEKPTPLLGQMAAKLGALHGGVATSEAFTKMLDEMGLIESFVFDVELADGTAARLAGFHTINEDKLAKLSTEQLGRLQEAGFLMPAFMVVASTGRFSDLVRRKNARLG
ncbi:SapC family protein [Sphingomicrobium nitratireducens]|uniref:SapC family protein n=1 Tax=Sphingomicrobium nitratireducens TaxID=2964666 RepID=UPI00223EBFA9|nr:SapC family protein [Sphingomicrobium nitratireducens]